MLGALELFVDSHFFKILTFNYSVGEVFFHHLLAFKVFPLCMLLATLSFSAL